MYRHTSWSLCSYLLSHHSWSWSMSNRNNSLLSMENKENSLWDSCNHEKVITTVQWKKNLLLPFFSMRTNPKSNFWMKTKLISTISFYIVVLNVKIWAIWLETPVRSQQWESIIFIINSIVFFSFGILHHSSLVSCNQPKCLITFLLWKKFPTIILKLVFNFKKS